MGLFARIKDWWTFRSLEKEFNKEVDENVNMYYHRDSVSEIQEDQDVQQKYYNGMALLKRRLRQQLTSNDPLKVMERFKGNKDFYVGGDLLALAKGESKEREQLAKGLNQVFVYQGADVKNSADTAKMIDKRINHYSTLQNKTEERELLRKVKKAYREGNMELHGTLMKEWEKKYGKSRNS